MHHDEAFSHSHSSALVLLQLARAAAVAAAVATLALASVLKPQNARHAVALAAVTASLVWRCAALALHSDALGACATALSVAALLALADYDAADALLVLTLFALCHAALDGAIDAAPHAVLALQVLALAVNARWLYVRARDWSHAAAPLRACLFVAIAVAAARPFIVAWLAVVAVALQDALCAYLVLAPSRTLFAMDPSDGGAPY